MILQPDILALFSSPSKPGWSLYQTLVLDETRYRYLHIFAIKEHPLTSSQLISEC